MNHNLNLMSMEELERLAKICRPLERIPVLRELAKRENANGAASRSWVRPLTERSYALNDLP